MLVYGWDRPRNGVSRVADNDQQIRTVGGGGAIAPPYFYIFPFSIRVVDILCPSHCYMPPSTLFNFQTFLRPCNAKLKGLSTRLIGKTKNLLLRKLGQVARQFSRQNKFLYPSFYSQCFLIRRLIDNS